ncbi:Semaphorin-3F [Liparis tanakae]|uniref:Semaphorin-3F n=1 Tax=Liparis tanakae TaxID=230148 RepID=A0A4Z2FYE8_9TELE|nr:Semaphorin-3F [Liparis tanakae]
MDEDHDRMYVGSKDHILSLDLHDINKEPHIIHWPVSERRRMECLVSGKDAKEECANFIRLVEPWNRTQLYICGTGAYNPVCTFVNRGRKPQTSMYLQMAQARGRASRAAEASAVHETLGLKVRMWAPSAPQPRSPNRHAPNSLCPCTFCHHLHHLHLHP